MFAGRPVMPVRPVTAVIGGKGIAQFGAIPPNQTLYVQQLNEKINIPELKSCLYELFTTYGEVIDVVASGSWKKKGQAFVVFRDISCATNALRALQGFTFLDKQMKINYSRTKSDIIALEDGTFKPRNVTGAEKDTAAKAKAMVRPKMAAAPASNVGMSRQAPPAAGAPAAAAAGAAAPSSEAQASNVLLVENLPADVSQTMLEMLFRQYPGFQEARPIKGRNIAFIEYADELQAGIARHGLQGFMVTPESALKINFAKQ